MSAKFVTLCVVGMLGSLFVGYCVYFDRKRRSDPDYKKKVVASESFHRYRISVVLCYLILVHKELC